MDGGLPYDDSEASAGLTVGGGLPYDDGDHPMLDRALDDVPTRSRGRDEPVPEHVQSLLGRMGKNKVYLAEESTGIIHHDAEARLRRDPRIAKLAAELDKQDPSAWLDVISETATSRIRPNALYVSSTLIQHLSTAKVFSWVSQAGASAMGMEWLNDSTLILLFATPAAALLGLSMLAKAGFDPTEGDDPLLERAAHAIPPSLLPQPEGRLTEDRDSGSRMETEDGVRRRGRGTFSAREPSGSAHGAFDLEPLAKPDIRGEIDVHARVTIRYATEGDAEARRGARASDWYARHGRGAGKEVTQRRFGREPLDLKDRVGTSGEGREFGRRIGRERAQPYARPQEPRRARASDLDAELENMASSRAAGNDRYERPRRERPRQPPRGNREDLDRDLDDMFAARSAQS